MLHEPSQRFFDRLLHERRIGEPMVGAFEDR
jgi:hypothetical protein